MALAASLARDDDSFSCEKDFPIFERCFERVAVPFGPGVHGCILAVARVRPRQPVALT